jgi:hypothetical protein
VESAKAAEAAAASTSAATKASVPPPPPPPVLTNPVYPCKKLFMIKELGDWVF